jgi:hypothetical protein
MLPKLSGYRRILAIALATASVVILVGAIAVFLWAPVERIATVPFRLLFDGAAQNRYPNGTAFSPTEIVGRPVLTDVFRANDLRRFGEYQAFEQSIFILGANPEVEILTNDYQARLGDNRLTPVERARIEEEFRTKRAALVDPVFSLNMRLSGGLTELPSDGTQKILSDILATWAEHAHGRKGATRYNVPILSTGILDRGLIEREDYFVALDILRAKTQRVISTIETLAALPGAEVVRAGPQKMSLAEIRSNLEDVIRFRLEPLLDLIRSEGMTRDARALRSYADNQLFQLKLEREQSLSLVRSLRGSLGLYTAQRLSETREAPVQGGAREPSTRAPAQSSMDQSFLDRLMAFSTASDEQAYRRTLTDRIIRASEEAGAVQREEAYYQDLARNLRTAGVRANGSPAIMALIKERTTQAFDEVAKAAELVSALYTELSAQNLRASMPLYTTTGPFTLGTRRAVALRTLGLGACLLLVFTFVSTLAACLVHHRVRARPSTESVAG